MFFTQLWGHPELKLTFKNHTGTLNYKRKPPGMNIYIHRMYVYAHDLCVLESQELDK